MSRTLSSIELASWSGWSSAVGGSLAGLALGDLLFAEERRPLLDLTGLVAGYALYRLSEGLYSEALNRRFIEGLLDVPSLDCVGQGAVIDVTPTVVS